MIGNYLMYLNVSPCFNVPRCAYMMMHDADEARYYYIPEISGVLCFWLRRRRPRRRRRTPTLVQAITLSQIHQSNSYSP